VLTCDTAKIFPMTQAAEFRPVVNQLRALRAGLVFRANERPEPGGPEEGLRGAVLEIADTVERNSARSLDVLGSETTRIALSAMEARLSEHSNSVAAAATEALPTTQAARHRTGPR
jgi:hypothetical protein